MPTSIAKASTPAIALRAMAYVAAVPAPACAPPSKLNFHSFSNAASTSSLAVAAAPSLTSDASALLPSRPNLTTFCCQP
jgi:hypothetical protein